MIDSLAERLRQTRIPLLHAFIVLVVSMSVAMPAEAESKRAELLVDRMLELTRSTLAKQRAIQHSGLTTEEIDERVKRITEEQVSQYADLEYQYNELPQRERMWGSTEDAARIRTQINRNLAETKKLVLEMVGPADAVPLPDDAATISSLVAKKDFIETFIMGMTVDGKPSPHQGQMLKMLDYHYVKSIRGDKVARDRLDRILDDVLEIYPTEQPLAQYNLGVFYREIGDVETARRWFRMAARHGVGPAVTALQALEE